LGGGIKIGGGNHIPGEYNILWGHPIFLANGVGKEYPFLIERISPQYKGGEPLNECIRPSQDKKRYFLNKPHARKRYM